MRRLVVLSAAVILSVFLICGSQNQSRAANGEVPGLHKMHLIIGIVANMKESGSSKKTFDALMNYTNRAPISADSLMRFWWRWALRECREPISEIIDREVKRANGKVIADDSKKRIEEERDNCVEAFIFDRWEKVSETIMNRSQNFERDN